MFLVLTVIKEILTWLAILQLEIARNVAAGTAEQLNSPLASSRYVVLTSQTQ